MALDGLHTRPSTLAHECNSLGIASKARDISSNPFQSSVLVLETPIGFITLVAQLFGCEEAGDSKTVAVQAV